MFDPQFGRLNKKPQKLWTKWKTGVQTGGQLGMNLGINSIKPYSKRCVGGGALYPFLRRVGVHGPIPLWHIL
jgi:hypothetical protein